MAESNSIEEMYCKLREKLYSMSKEDLEEEYEHITHEKFYGRWIEKLHNLTKEQRFTFIEKVNKKYSSDEYKTREINRGYEPRENLYDLICLYSKEYGENCPDSYYTEFVAMARIIDNAWLVRLYIGQGSFVTVDKIDNI